MHSLAPAEVGCALVGDHSWEQSASNHSSRASPPPSSSSSSSTSHGTSSSSSSSRSCLWWKELVAGGLAGIAQEGTTYPIDTIRVRLDVGGVSAGPAASLPTPSSSSSLMAAPSAHAAAASACSSSSSSSSSAVGSSPAPRNMQQFSSLAVTSSFPELAAPARRPCPGPFAALAQVCRETWRAEGWRGFYGGLGVSLAWAVPTSAVYFWSYKGLQRELQGYRGSANEDSTNAIAGFGAEMVSAVVGTPGDVMAQRLQVSPVGTSASKVFSDILREGGVRQLWVGYWGYLVVWGPFSATYFMVYEMSKTGWAKRLDGPNASPDQTFSSAELASGTAAGGIAALVTQPLDCIKTRLQVGRQQLSPILAASSLSRPCSSSAVGLLKQVLREEGCGALFRGAAARALWLAPASGLTIAIFEGLTRRLTDLEHDL